MRTLSSHKPVLYTIPPLAPAPAPQDPRCRVPAASSQVSRPRPSAARCIVYNRDLVAREAASLSHYLLNPTLALGGAHVASGNCNVWQVVRQLAGILHANQSTPLSLGTKLGAAVKPKTPTPTPINLGFWCLNLQLFCPPP